jgi:hypothetical protein
MQLKVAQNIFRIISRSLDIIEAYRVPFVSERQRSTVIAPTQFKTKSQMELISEVTELKSKGAPLFFISESSRQLAKKLYGDDPIVNKMVDVASQYDILFPLTTQEVGLMKANGSIDAAQVTKHQYTYSMLQKIAMEDVAAFESLTYDQIAERLDVLILPLVPTQNNMLNDALGQLV